MPTYEYACDACEHHFEEFQSITAAPLRKCPECGKPKLKRLIGTGGGVIFKGSGFYTTDYRSESYKKSAEAEKSKPAAPDSTKSGDNTAPPTPKSESAPAKKAAEKPGGKSKAPTPK